tara:strand:+ start:7301 stop:9535 length:2235 start_codon:yes stop_codon:yes gene_type:complete
MKKGLLSLLAVALTVVSCQNYDDQFDELSDQITALSNVVQGLSTVSDQITALQNTVNGLELTLGGEISSIKTAVEALSTALEDVATASDLATISSTLADVQADVKELLAANAVINQDITINNVATLEYVESLISTDADDPNVIVNGKITVEVDDSDFDDEHLPRILAVTNKFATGLKEMTVTHTYSPTSIGPGPILTFDNLAFVDSDLTISGSTTLADGDTGNDNLRTVSGGLFISNVVGDLDLGLLTSAASITIPENVTALKMGAVNAGSIRTDHTGTEAGNLQLPKATIVDGGKSKVVSVVANKAVSIDVTVAATATIKGDLADTINIGGTAVTGLLDISGNTSGTTVVNAKSIKTAVNTITTGALGELHLTALTSAGTITSGAKVVDLAKLASITPKDAAVQLDSVSDTLDLSALTVTGSVTANAAASIIVKDHKPAEDTQTVLINGNSATSLEIKALSTNMSITFTAAAGMFPVLKNLTVKGVGSTSSPFISTITNLVSITSDKLETVNIDGTVNAVYLDDMAVLKTLSTKSGSFIRNFTLFQADEIVELDMNHDHIEGSDAALLHIHDAAKLKKIAPTALDEVGTVSLTTLPKLTELDLSSMKVLPIVGHYNITVSATGLTGSYGIASELSTTTPEFGDAIFSDDLMTLSPLMKLAAANGLVTYTFSGDIISNISTRTFDKDGVPNAIVSTNGTTTLNHVLEGYTQYVNTTSNIATPVGEAAFAESVAGSPTTAQVRAE